MVRKILEGFEQEVKKNQRLMPPRPPKSPIDSYAFQKGYYSTSSTGPLMDLSTIANVLHLLEPPKMRSAKLVGHHLMLWGESPALLDFPGREVYGRECEIENQEQSFWLTAYSTDRYRLRACRIRFLDRPEGQKECAVGETFVWDGESEELRGVFSLEE